VFRIRIQDPNFSTPDPDPGSKRYRIPDPALRLRIFHLKIVRTKLLDIGMICLFIPESQNPDLDFYPSRIPNPGVKKTTSDPGSGTLLNPLHDSLPFRPVLLITEIFIRIRVRIRGSVSLSNGSGYGRLNNLWMLRIRIRNPATDHVSGYY
jgi:hypothetical protein